MCEDYGGAAERNLSVFQFYFLNKFKGPDHLKDQNGVSGSGHQNGAGWLLWIWFQTCFGITENLNCLNCIKLADTTSVFKIVSASSCQLQPSGLKVVIYNYATISEHSQSLLYRHSYFLLAPILFFDKHLM